MKIKPPNTIIVLIGYKDWKQGNMCSKSTKYDSAELGARTVFIILGGMP